MNGDLQEWSAVSKWLYAFRPKTLPAAVAPVIVGTASAVADGRFSLLPALSTATGALLLQIGVNLANDYFDFVKGVDTSERIGPIRVTQSGLIPVSRVKASMTLSITLAAIIGVYLVKIGGWPILVIGIASILSALGYSGGPYPLASHGLGDLFVFVFFGPVAVCGTYYIQALELKSMPVLTSIPVGLLITAILVVNNLRDIETDQKTGKYTLAVFLGYRGAINEFIALIVISFALLPFYWLVGLLSGAGLLPLLTAPFAVLIIRNVSRLKGGALNDQLGKTALLSFAYSLLLSLGLLI